MTFVLDAGNETTFAKKSPTSPEPHKVPSKCTRKDPAELWGQMSCTDDGSERTAYHRPERAIFDQPSITLSQGLAGPVRPG